MSTGLTKHPVDTALSAKIDTVRQVLPDSMKSHAERLMKRAMITFHTGSAQLKKATPASFVTCVIKAAEQGLPIDGKLGHAVPYNVKVKDADGRERWEVQAQFQADYKGLIVVARRLKLIQDAWFRIVYENDEFDMYEQNGVMQYAWRPNIPNPGKPLLVFGVVTHRDGWYRVDYMNMADIQAIKERSQSFKSGYGPWFTDEGEMQKKTVARRILKTFTDDPGMLELIHAGDAYEFPDGDMHMQPRTQQRARLSTLNVPRVESQSVAGELVLPVEHVDTVAAVEPTKSKKKATVPAAVVQREPGDESETDGQLFDTQASTYDAGH